MGKAACLDLDVDIFFPKRGQGSREAREVCSTCDVIVDCKKYAKEMGTEHGVFAGEMKDKEPKRGGAAPD